MKMEDLLKIYLSSKKDGCKFMLDVVIRFDILYQFGQGNFVFNNEKIIFEIK